MRPNDLKHPFPWEERQVVIQDRVFFVPTHYKEHGKFQFPGWQDPVVFGNDNPVYVEYCSGNGSWVIERAKASPEVNWVAVEMRFDRLQKIWSKAKNREISNLLALSGEAFTATKHYFPTATVDKMFLNFPDPWPKRRHAKHRLITPEFLTEVCRMLKPGGTAMIVTDDPEYSRLAIDEFLTHGGFESVLPAPFFVTSWEGYGSSFFEELWREKGRDILYHQFRKKA